jgi:hypothetical protein
LEEFQGAGIKRLSYSISGMRGVTPDRNGNGNASSPNFNLYPSKRNACSASHFVLHLLHQSPAQ